MEAAFTYLIKSGALIATFWLAYHLLLRHETFFKSNRWYLLFGLVTSVILPVITFKKLVWIEPNPDNLHWAPFPGNVVPVAQSFEINWWHVAGAIYIIGIAAFMLRFCTDIYSLRKALKGKRITQQADFKFVDTRENIAPFSYFSYIVYNSSLYSPMELQNILEHEKVHSDQHHSIDVLITRVFCIVFWFNPFVWLYKKSILQNLEFIADNEATKNLADKKAYQFTLLKVTAHENCVDITNHFYQSLIKKRIVMLNKNQSKKRNSWKYALVVPVLAAFMFYFQVKVIAQEKPAPPTPVQSPPQQPDVRVMVDKNTSDEEMKREAERVKKEHGVTLKFSKVKRNGAGEITSIKMEFKDQNGKKGITQVVDDKPIKPISFYKNDDGAIGFGQPTDGRIYRRNHNDEDREERVVYMNGDDEDFDFDFDFDFDVDAPEPPEAPEMAEMAEPAEPPHPPHPPHPIERNIVITQGSDGPMVIVDGEIVTDEKRIREYMAPMKQRMKVIKRNGVKVYSGGNSGFVHVDGERIAREASDRAREEVRRARPEIERAMEQVKKTRIEIDRTKLSKEEMEEVRKEMDRAEEELKKARLDLDKQLIELENQREKENRAAGERSGAKSAKK